MADQATELESLSQSWHFGEKNVPNQFDGWAGSGETDTTDSKVYGAALSALISFFFNPNPGRCPGLLWIAPSARYDTNIEIVGIP